MDNINVTGNKNGTELTESFSVAFCHLIDFEPNVNGNDCSSIDPSKCIRCPIVGTYFTGESVNDYGSMALKYYYTTWILILFVSVIGIVNNILILMVMKKRKNLNSFDLFLVVLAGFDALSSFLTISGSTSCAAYFGRYYMFSFNVSFF